MAEEGSGAGMTFYERLLLAYCFPDGAEDTEHLRGELEPKLNRRRRDQIGDRGTAVNKDRILATGPDGRRSCGRAISEAAVQR